MPVFDNDNPVIVPQVVPGPITTVQDLLAPRTIVVKSGQAPGALVPNVTKSPVPAVQNALGPNGLVIGTPGPQGPPGANGGGSGTQNVFIQNSPPVSPPAQYLWIQTGLGGSGQDMTFWVQP